MAQTTQLISAEEAIPAPPPSATEPPPRTRATPAQPQAAGGGLGPDSVWYKSGVFYEVHVRAFYDANGDGTGDFRGLTEKLDYIKDLGVTAIWLLPFYPSPLKDDGYDIANYCAVHPMYGTLGDFRLFLRQAHRRGLRVITELVLNHTSDQHPWFTRARHSKPGSRWRNFYVWSDSPKKYSDARIIFKDVEVSNWTWDRVANAYYWHRFYSHQPDLNFENPEVHEKLRDVVDFWLDMGVDGMRLDAVPYLYEHEGTTCENLPETHEFLRSLRAHVDKKYSNRMLLAEANQWPEDAVAYFGQGPGDECHMAFHFPLMPRLFMALRMEDRLPIVDILEQTPAIPETCQWALFLRNHDELTLEMVTDEERDYMYRMYAQAHQARLNLGIRRRLAPLLGNDRKRIELLNALLFSLPGTPVLYYGDEIGLGENIYLGDRNGVRTPMQWSSDKNAGFSRANPQSLYLPIILDPAYHYEANNVEAQLTNPHSLLWWMRRMLQLRKRWRALGEGKCEFLQPDNVKILSYILRHASETLLVVANLSRFTQPVELDLAAFKSMVPVELFGRTRFPPVGDKPYSLALGPHNFYLFSLEPASPTGAKTDQPSPAALPLLRVEHDWFEVLVGNHVSFDAALSEWLKAQAWFTGTPSNVRFAVLKDYFRIPLADGGVAALLFVQVEYADGNPDMFAVPVAFAAGTDTGRSRENAIAEITFGPSGPSGVVHDGFEHPGFATELLEMIYRRERIRNGTGELEPMRAHALRQVLSEGLPSAPAVQTGRSGSTQISFGDKVSLEFFRHVESGIHPELEISRFLSDRGFARVPLWLGALGRSDASQPPVTLAVVKALVPRATDGWAYSLDTLSRYFERVVASEGQGHPQTPLPAAKPATAPGQPVSEAVDFVGSYVETARLLGTRTAELHLALASGDDGSDFGVEPMTSYYLRGLFQSMRSLAVRNLRKLRRQLKLLPPDIAPLAQRAVDLEGPIIQQFRSLLDGRAAGQRIRIHGDFNLERISWTGKDFVFPDFAGNIREPISERRIKRSPLRDVAVMLRSFHHAADAGLRQQVELGVIPGEQAARYEPWVRRWRHEAGRAFWRAYIQAMSASAILPGDEAQLRVATRTYLLHVAIEELGRELGDASDGLRVALEGLLDLAGDNPPAAAH